MADTSLLLIDPVENIRMLIHCADDPAYTQCGSENHFDNIVVAGSSRAAYLFYDSTTQTDTT